MVFLHLNSNNLKPMYLAYRECQKSIMRPSREAALWFLPVRPSVRVSVSYTRAPNSETKKRTKTKPAWCGHLSQE